MDFGPGPPRGRAALAWLVPWVGTALLWIFADELEDAVGFELWSSLALLVGVLLGVCWYLLYPRPLARRVVAPVVVISVVALISGIVGEFASALSGSVLFVLFGMLTGLTVTELLRSRRRSSIDAGQPVGAVRVD